MDGKFFRLCMAFCLVSSASACNEGEYKNLDCDPATHRSECLASNAYMYCRDGILAVVECGLTQVCSKTAAADGTTATVSCKAIDGVVTECATNADCTDSTKPVCASGKCVAGETPESECATSADCTDSTKPVCASGKCVAGETPSVVDPCKDVTCAEGTCDRGVCVTDDMKKLKIYDDCDADTFVEFCNGNQMVYCSSSGYVYMTDCAADAGCSVVMEELDGETYPTAWCNNAIAGRCTGDEEKIPYCAIDADFGNSYASYYLCRKNTEGKFTAQDYNLYNATDMCLTTCNEAGTACAVNACETDGAVSSVCWLDEAYVVRTTCMAVSDGVLTEKVTDIEDYCSYGCENGACKKLFDGEGESCDDTYVQSCKGENDSIVTYCSGGTATGEACGDGEKCLTVAGKNYAGCYDPGEAGCTVGTKTTVCTAGLFEDYSVDYVCATMSDGSTQRVPDSEGKWVECEYGCNAEGTGCAVLVDDSAPTKCTADGTNYCTGIKGLYDANARCAVYKGAAVCYLETCEDADAGKIVGNETCDMYQGNSSHKYKKCLKADDNSLIVASMTGSCKHGCDEGGVSCRTITDDEGTACGSDFAARCDGNVAVTCADGVIDATECAELVCGVFTDKAARCYTTDSTSCTDPGTVSHQCYASEGVNYSLKWQCMSLSDNSGSYKILEDYETCSGSCDEKTGKCAVSGATE